jgi:hypothetical protein
MDLLYSDISGLFSTAMVNSQPWIVVVSAAEQSATTYHK